MQAARPIAGKTFVGRTTTSRCRKKPFSAKMGKDKTPKKEKEEDKMEEDGEEEEESQIVLSVIASPLAKDKLVKKLLKLVKTGKRVLTPMH